ncbi:MAG: hypothetical protein JKX73_03770, partial [Flavobacteriales bacterium]|nr:hypothetical protein [Flavobacteriales bacterium]
MHRFSARTVVILLCCLITSLLSAQTPVQGESEMDLYIDSLERVLASAKEDTHKVQLLNSLCIQYQQVDNEKSLEYGFNALDLSTTLQYRNGVFQSYDFIGSTYYYIGNYSKALEYFQKRLKLIVPEDVENMAQCYQEIGNAYSGQGNYFSGLEYCNKAAALF